MKLAVMQPYIFPYIGYYQLLNTSDVFVLYDDVTFIKNGFINRNRLKLNGEARWFTLPAKGASSNTKITEIELLDANNQKIFKSLEQNYTKSPFFQPVFSLFQQVIANQDRSVVSIAEASLRTVIQYLGLEKQIIRASQLDYPRTESAQSRLIQLCRLLGCDSYINSIGGKSLYDKASFKEAGICLSFISPRDITYPQGKGPFLPYLSIVDHLMWCSKDQVLDQLNAFTLE